MTKGSAYRSDLDLVFPAPEGDGSPWTPSNFSRMFHHHAHRLGFTCRLHDLRHSHASQLLAQETDVKTISTRLGHSSTSFTLDTYVKPFRGSDDEAAERYDAALEKGAAARYYGRTTATRRRSGPGGRTGGGKGGHLREV